DVHELERAGLDPVRLDRVCVRVCGALRHPRPDLPVVLGIGVRGEPELHRVALALHDLRLRVLAEELRPALDVVHPLPDLVDRAVDDDRVVRSRHRYPSFSRRFEYSIAWPTVVISWASSSGIVNP